MYTVEKFPPPSINVVRIDLWRIRCPDGRYIGRFNDVHEAEIIAVELNGLKNPN